MSETKPLVGRMTSMLAELHHHGVDDGQGNRVCPFCFREPFSDDDPNDRDIDHPTHKIACELTGILREAGAV